MVAVLPPSCGVFDFDSVFGSVGGQHDADGAEDAKVGAFLDVVPAAHFLQPFNSVEI